MTDEIDVVVTRGSTYENAANLSPKQLAKLRARYEGTARGRQELYAEVLEDVPGALWTREVLDSSRIKLPQDQGKVPVWRRVVVGVDPMVTDIASKAEMERTGISSLDPAKKPGGSETGIVVAALGLDGHGYVLDDMSLSASPATWANRAIAAYEKWRADRVIGEQNNGGALVEVTLRSINANLPYKAVVASRGKITRAEPVAGLYEQGKVHHIGLFPILEDQMVTYTGNPNERSPDRMDALVWALTELMLGDLSVPMVGPIGIDSENYGGGGNNG